MTFSYVDIFKSFDLHTSVHSAKSTRIHLGERKVIKHVQSQRLDTRIYPMSTNLCGRFGQRHTEWFLNLPISFRAHSSPFTVSFILSLSQYRKPLTAKSDQVTRYTLNCFLLNWEIRDNFPPVKVSQTFTFVL